MNNKSKLIFVYITASNSAEAETLSKALLQKKLIACSNVFPEIKSFYHWDGEIQSSSECVMICKSTSNQFEAIKNLVTELHSYDTPCVVSIPLEGSHPPFADWLLRQIN